MEVIPTLPGLSILRSVNSVDVKYLRAVHSAAYVAAQSCGGAHSWNQALEGVAVVCAATDNVMLGRHTRALCVVHAVGHDVGRTGPVSVVDDSANPSILNVTMVAARYALLHHDLQRVCMLDWSLKDGFGTRSLVEQDDNFLYLHLHQEELALSRADDALANVDPFTLRVNAVLEKIREFQPQLVFLTAAFDAPRWHDRDFFLATAQLCEVLDDHSVKLVSVVEPRGVPSPSCVELHAMALLLPEPRVVIEGADRLPRSLHALSTMAQAFLEGRNDDALPTPLLAESSKRARNQMKREREQDQETEGKQVSGGGDDLEDNDIYSDEKKSRTANSDDDREPDVDVDEDDDHHHHHQHHHHHHHRRQRQAPNPVFMDLNEEEADYGEEESYVKQPAQQQQEQQQEEQQQLLLRQPQETRVPSPSNIHQVRTELLLSSADRIPHLDFPPNDEDDNAMHDEDDGDDVEGVPTGPSKPQQHVVNNTAALMVSPPNGGSVIDEEAEVEDDAMMDDSLEGSGRDGVDLQLDYELSERSHTEAVESRRSQPSHFHHGSREEDGYVKPVAVPMPPSAQARVSAAVVATPPKASSPIDLDEINALIGEELGSV